MGVKIPDQSSQVQSHQVLEWSNILVRILNGPKWHPKGNGIQEGTLLDDTYPKSVPNFEWHSNLGHFGPQNIFWMPSFG